MEVAVSYLKSKYDKETTVSLIDKSCADYIHVDLMDGGFVPTRNFTVPEVLELLGKYEKRKDIHLMVFDPIIYIDELAKLKPTYITFHVEATHDIVKTIERIKWNNIKVGLAISPNTNILELMPYLSLVDLVLIMSVMPGVGGQEFILSTTERLKELIEIRNNSNLSFKIEVDGGINDTTVENIRESDIIVSGVYVCMSDNFDKQIDYLKSKTV